LQVIPPRHKPSDVHDADDDNDDDRDLSNEDADCDVVMKMTMMTMMTFPMAINQTAALR